MPQTYAQLQKQIATLEAEARKLKTSEAAAVIEKIKELIEVYDLKVADLFGSAGAKGGKTSRAKVSRAKYADSNGNTWVGMGKRPQWIRDALAAGKSIEEFAVSGAGRSQPSAGAAPSKKPGATGRKGAGKAKFGDGVHSWTGFGPQPRWLKDAVAAGKRLEDFRV